MKTTTRRFLSNLSLSLVITVGLLTLYIIHPLPLQWLDHRIYDIILRQQDPGTASPIPVIIDIDEKSLKALGQWPWPRYRMAQLVQVLTNSGALAIGLDIILAEPDQSSPLLIQKNLADNFQVQADLSSIPQELHNNDLLLSKVLAQSPVVLGMFMQFKQKITQPTASTTASSTAAPASGINWVEQKLPKAVPASSFILQAQGATLPLEGLQAVAPLGFINATPDSDGVIRSLPLLVHWENKLYPSLGLRTLMQALNIKTSILKSGLDGLESIRLGPYTIPVSNTGIYQLLFRGPRGMYPYYSAIDVLEGKIDQSKLAGRILFIGTSAPGLLDIRTTPFDPIFPGVESHAALIDNILSQRHLVSPPWEPGVQVVVIIFVAICCSLAFGLARPAIYLAVAVGLVAATLGSAQYLFQSGYYFTPLYAILCIMSMGGGLLLLRFWQVDQQKYVLQKAFSNYVAPEVVSRIVERGSNILQGESRLVTLIFTDIRGFTSISEKLPPEQIVTMLNQYFTPMTALIIRSGGTVDKFIGDAIMAFWNAPLDIPHHPIKALQTALDMQSSLKELNVELQKTYGVSLAVGAGIHTGMVHVGNMGSAELLDYTCIGDTVNLTSRLESLCSVYGVTTITSTTTKEYCEQEWQESQIVDPPFFFRPLDSILVKGKTQPIATFFVLPAKEYHERAEEFALSDQAFALYQEGNFEAAQKIFLKLSENYPNHKVYELYTERCDTLIATPPLNWNGVWIFTSK